MAVDQELDNLLYAAIENMRLIRFTCRGKDRITEPHDYGIEHGIVRLFCWQVGGKSNGHVPGWVFSMLKEWKTARCLSASSRAAEWLHQANIIDGTRFSFE
jgi:hypothetical protein